MFGLDPGTRGMVGDVRTFFSLMLRTIREAAAEGPFDRGVGGPTRA